VRTNSRPFAVSWWLCRATLAVGLVILAGCGSGFDLRSVSGQITLRDGTPLAGVRITCECPELRVSATAVTDEHGHFRLTTLDSGDGAPVGSYQVAVVDARGEDMDDPTPIRIHARYRRYETSGLTFSVGDGTNEWEIRLDPPR